VKLLDDGITTVHSFTRTDIFQLVSNMQILAELEAEIYILGTQFDRLNGGAARLISEHTVGQVNTPLEGKLPPASSC
jgi:hypothetical protein